MTADSKGRELFIVDNSGPYRQKCSSIGAAHRAHVPGEKTLDSVLAAVEALLYRLYVLPGEVKLVEASTPKRPLP